MATCTEMDCGRPTKGRGLCGTHYAFRRRHGTLPPKPPPVVGCSEDGCPFPHEAFGLCRKHYQRVRSTGSLEQPLATGPDDVRFWAKVNRHGPIPEHRPDLGPCWLWEAGISGNTGYGNAWWQGLTQSAHRVAYKLLVGPIPEAMTLDHLCLVKPCVKVVPDEHGPAHLEVVTLAENIRRMERLLGPDTRALRATAGRKGAAIRWANSPTRQIAR